MNPTTKIRLTVEVNGNDVYRDYDVDPEHMNWSQQVLDMLDSLGEYEEA